MTIHPHGRRLAATGLALLTAEAALAAGCTDSSGEDTAAEGGLGGEVIWAGFGGPTYESRQVAYVDGFAEEYGVEVTSVPIEDAVYYPMLEGESGDYDVFQVSAAEPLNYPDGGQELPESAQSDLLPGELRPYLMGGFYLGLAQGWLTDTFVLPAEANNPDAVLALAEWMNDPEHQVTFVERTGYDPVNSEVFDSLDPELAATLPNAPEHEDLVIPRHEQWRAENKQAMLDPYTEWLAG